MTQANMARPRRARDPFEDLVVRDAFGNTTTIEAAMLRARDSVLLFEETLRVLVEKVEGQIAADNTRPIGTRDPDWRRRALTLRSQLVLRLREVTQLAKAERVRQNGGQ